MLERSCLRSDGIVHFGTRYKSRVSRLNLFHDILLDFEENEIYLLHPIVHIIFLEENSFCHPRFERFIIVIWEHNCLISSAMMSIHSIK